MVAAVASAMAASSCSATGDRISSQNSDTQAGWNVVSNRNVVISGTEFLKRPDDLLDVGGTESSPKRDR